MKDELRQVAKDTLKLFYLCEQLDEMNDPNTKRYYDSLDFTQMESEIKEMKDLVIMKIEKL